MDKNKLANEYASNCNVSWATKEWEHDVKTFLAGFDAAESIANAKIQELQDFRQAQVEEIKRCDSNLKLLNSKITELEKEQVLHIELLAQEYEKSYKSKITELEQQLKKAESVIEFYGKQDNWAKSFMGIPSCITNQEDHEEIKFEGEKIHCGGKLARQYLSRGE